MGRRSPSGANIGQVAAEAGVSAATVSRVITGADRVAPETARRVREAIRALGYEPNRLAQGLRRRRTMTIGLVLSGFTNSFFFELIAQTAEVGKEAGYSMLVSGDADPEGEALRLAGGRIVDGIVFVAAHGESRASRLNDLSIPIVCFDRAPADLSCPVVQIDNERGAREVTRHLADQGARRIAHIAGPAEVLASQPRRTGYRLALEDAGIERDPALEVPGDFTEEAGYRAMYELLGRGEPFDGVFAANDLMAIGAMRAAAESGIRVPDDLLVGGFDGISSGRFTVPRLTTCAQPISHMARLAVAKLLRTIESGETAQHREDIVVAGELLVRESSTRCGSPQDSPPAR
ncbi:transcriptional regulator, LacI family [Saccharopolyspora kobensis]|uniref:Transcriptional regulator, LacI family n=1 Tax=Saccharopolyspora kobensis TaxID=146035 RepID=A0A1H5U2M9_9PSEU|nr:substrate-binding domain-containing protein [Saccharopolyspora kobensis]SEF69345.1 transcriptional regulator, LacI family [Saccharopolyspora kobensis]SFC77954.1 transcriptional regulator, LacI family [Saccharopolyspora kobensis]